MQTKLDIANFPTKIEKMPALSEELQKDIYIKRDDQTGTEFSGNKIRKLEYSLKEALDSGAKVVITCGGIQSNHARATAAAAIKLGLKTILVLRSDTPPVREGNYFLDLLLGADVRIISSADYRERRGEIMREIREESDRKGEKAYIIPEGASNGIGSLGYATAVAEILAQEKETGLCFDTLVVPVGSGGTYAGLYLGNKLYKAGKDVIGFNVCDDADFFRNKSVEIIAESLPYLDNPDVAYGTGDMHIIDGYVGRGYALSRPEELAFLKKIAVADGVIFDPVYTGKALYGLYHEIKKGNLKESNHILFIHTGGLFGLFPKQDEFSL